MRFGKANCVCNSEIDVERCQTTIFIVFLCFPLLPTGTYLVEKKRALPDRLTGPEKLPLGWEQILRVWVVAAGAILALIWLIELVSSDAAWKFVHLLTLPGVTRWPVGRAVAMSPTSRNQAADTTLFQCAHPASSVAQLLLRKASRAEAPAASLMWPD